MIEPIEGAGLVLRGYRPEDRDVVESGFSDPVTLRFMPALPVPFTRRQADWWIAEGAPAVVRGGGAAYAVADQVTGEVLGGIGLDNVIPGRGQAEIGYWVAPAARDRGVARRAVRALSAHAFGTGTRRLELITHWENAASQRVALAAGFQRESARRSLLPNRSGGRDDVLVFVRLADDPGEPVARLLPDLPGGVLTDGVVTLRPLGPGDGEFLTELFAVPDIIASGVPPEPRPADEIRRRCARAGANWLNGNRADLIIHDAATGAPTGDIGLYYDAPQLREAMIGYSLLPAWRGRGYTTRALRLLALWTFAETGIARLIAGTVPSNEGSQRVLRKAGFKREAVLRSRLPGGGDTRHDEVQFCLLAQDVLTTE